MFLSWLKHPENQTMTNWRYVPNLYCCLLLHPIIFGGFLPPVVWCFTHVVCASVYFSVHPSVRLLVHCSCELIFLSTQQLVCPFSHPSFSLLVFVCMFTHYFICFIFPINWFNHPFVQPLLFHPLSLCPSINLFLLPSSLQFQVYIGSSYGKSRKLDSKNEDKS